MEIKILNKIENALLNRTEITAEIFHEGKPTPTRDDIRKHLAAMLGSDESLLSIKHVKSGVKNSSMCSVTLYKSKEELEKLEAKHILKREKKISKEAPKAAGAAA